jgi:hypothetical protein
MMGWLAERPLRRRAQRQRINLYARMFVSWFSIFHNANKWRHSSGPSSFVTFVQLRKAVVFLLIRIRMILIIYNSISKARLLFQ